MKEAIGILAIIVCVCALMYLSFLEGEKSAQNEIEQRAYQYKITVRQNQTLEKIIFNSEQP